MFCERCGAAIDGGEKFCSACGAKVPAGEENALTKDEQANVQYKQQVNTQYQQPVNTQYQQPVNTQYQQPVNAQYQQPVNTQYQQPVNAQYQQVPKQKSNTALIIIIVLLLLIIIAGGVIAFLMINNKTGSNEGETGKTAESAVEQIGDQINAYAGAATDAADESKPAQEAPVQEVPAPEDDSLVALDIGEEESAYDAGIEDDDYASESAFSDGETDYDENEGTDGAGFEYDDEYICPTSNTDRFGEYFFDEQYEYERRGVRFPGGRSYPQMVINEIYARHGYIFKDEELQRYFEEKSWYRGKTRDMATIEKQMNQIEKDNIKFLKQ